MNRSALLLAGPLRRLGRWCLFPGARLRYRARTLALSAALLPALALASAVRADEPPLSLPEAQRLAAVRSKQVEASDLAVRSEEHTSELQSHHDLVCRLLLEKKKRA